MRFSKGKAIAKKLVNIVLTYIGLKKRHEIYISKNNITRPWIFISYIPEVFYIKSKAELARHQNQQEMLAMLEVFSKLDYNVYIMNYESKKVLPNLDVQIVFGIEPCFLRACEKYHNAKKIYYGTTAYYSHQNKMVTKMTDDFNKYFKCRIPYRRMVVPHNSCQIADNILQIGSKYTIETYPEEVRHKITLIDQSTQAAKALDFICYAKENEYVYMGSGGNALKGVGLLIAYFTTHTDNVIHIIGPIEREVKKAIKPVLTPNIHLHGFMNVNDSDYLAIIKRCNFLINLSGSEGCPGAVLNLMKNGLIPIVSRWSAFDKIAEYGYVLNDLEITSLDDAMSWSKHLSKDKIAIMKENAKEFIENTYNLPRYKKQLFNYFVTTVISSKES